MTSANSSPASYAPGSTGIVSRRRRTVFGGLALTSALAGCSNAVDPNQVKVDIDSNVMRGHVPATYVNGANQGKRSDDVAFVVDGDHGCVAYAEVSGYTDLTLWYSRGDGTQHPLAKYPPDGKHGFQFRDLAKELPNDGQVELTLKATGTDGDGNSIESAASPTLKAVIRRHGDRYSITFKGQADMAVSKDPTKDLQGSISCQMNLPDLG